MTDSNPDGYATVPDLMRVCRLSRGQVLTAIRKLDIPVFPLRGDGWGFSSRRGSWLETAVTSSEEGGMQ